MVILLLGIGGYFAYQAGTKAIAELDPVGRDFIGRIYAGEIDSAWGMVSEEWKRTSNREDFGKWTESVRKHFNDVPQASREGFRFYRGTGGSIETLTYRLRQGGSGAVMKLNFTRRKRKPYIAGANFSPSSSAPR
jgi:hypothetical protein